MPALTPPTQYLETGQVARQLGVSVEAVRMWERRGTIAPPLRTIGGRRLFRAEDVETIRTEREARQAARAAGSTRPSAA
jgi:excisionase family DNA binding protein